jgi:hypothetical protein
MPFVSSIARAATPQWTARQFHNQPAASPLNEALVKLWEKVAKETKGRLIVTVYPQNNGIAGSDPAALEMLRKGELEFYTLLAGILSNAVPAMDIQGMPFAFKRSEQIHSAMDGELGVYLRAECKTKGIYLFPHGLLENGFRDLNTVTRRVRVADDMAGLRVRFPIDIAGLDLAALVGWRLQSFQVRNDRGAAISAVPDLDVQALQLGVAARIPLATPLALTLDAAYLHGLDLGAMGQRFPGSSTAGVLATAGLALRIVWKLELRAAFEMRLWAHTLGRPAGAVDAPRSAEDRYLGGTFGLAVRL